MTLAKLRPVNSAYIGIAYINSAKTANSGYQSWQNRNWNRNLGGSLGKYVGDYSSRIVIRLRDHWNSWVTRSAKVCGPSPWAMASIACTPRHPAALISIEVE